jgi:hypothetical protein
MRKETKDLLTRLSPEEERRKKENNGTVSVGKGQGQNRHGQAREITRVELVAM